MTQHDGAAVRRRTFRPARALARLARMRSGWTIAALIPALVLAWLALREPPPVPALRDLVFDSYLRAKPRIYDPAVPVRVVDIDDASLAQHGQWPWPRSLMARLTRSLQEAGAAAIAFDILMAEPDRYSLEQVAAGLSDPAQRQALESMARASPSNNDALFAEALAGESSIVAMVGADGITTVPPVKSGFAAAGDHPRAFVPALQGAILSLPQFVEPAAGLASLNFFPDRDLVVRRVPTLVMIGGKPAPALGLEALRVAQRASTIITKASNASGETAFGAQSGMISVRVGDIAIATERDGAVRVHYAGPQAARRISARTVLAGESDPAALKGAIVFVGSSAAGMDIRATPLQPAVAGIDVHAEFAEHVLGGSHLVRPDYANGLEAAIILLAGLAAAAFALHLRATLGALLAAAAIGVILAGSWAAFAWHGLLLEPVLPSLAMMLGYGGAMILAYRSTERDRARIRNAFSRYVSPAVIETLAADPSRLKLGGENRDVTVMFTDIRNFTALSERLPAEQVVQFLNAVHTPLTEAVMRYGGTIDKYFGDGMMAFWNAPLDAEDHVRQGLRAALAIVDLVPALAEALTPAGAAQPLRIGIGLNTGTACVGNLGSTTRFDYSIVGDTVNSTARLEQLTKDYCVAVLVADSVVIAAPDFAYALLDITYLRGRESVSRIHALLGDETAAARPEFKAFTHLHEKAIDSRLSDEARAAAVAELAQNPFGQQMQDFYRSAEARAQAA